MEPYDQHLIEGLAVVDIDPSLNRFNTTCKCSTILVRVEMDN